MTKNPQGEGEFNLPVDNRLLGLGTISGHFVFAPKNIPQGCQAGTRLIFIQDSIEMKHIKKNFIITDKFGLTKIAIWQLD